MYEILLTDRALKSLKDIPKADVNAFWEKIEIVASNPYGELSFSKKLKNSKYFRFRFGNYRCVYEIENNNLKVIVIDVGNRKNIYRR